MNRRELLGKLSILLAGPVVLKAAACVTEIDGAPPPAGDGGGGADQFAVMNQDGSGHTHMFWIECEQRGAGPWTYLAEGAHSHQVTLTSDELDAVFRGEAVTVQTTAGHPHTWMVQMPAGMCAPGGGSDGGSGGGGGGW